MTDLAWAAAQLSARRPDHSLPSPLYNDPRALAFDLDAIFARSWLMGCMECELPKAGSYIAFTVGQWPVIVVRDKAGEIRAFHNSCRHRGSVLCPNGHGSAPKLVCPYHRWTYDLDGSLFAAGRMPEQFDKRDHGLAPIALRRVAGAVFVCLADDPPEFESFAAPFADYAGPLDFTQLKLAATDLLVEEANWKLVMENARECYHCATGHPELAQTFPVQHGGHYGAGATASAETFTGEMDAAGLPHASLEGSWWQIARFALNPGARTISMDGEAVCAQPLTAINGGNVGSLRFATEPNMFAHATGDHLFVFTCMPVGPHETHVYSRWYVHKDAVEGVDYDVDRLKELWLKTNAQDKALAENNQRGVLSPGYRPGPYSLEAEPLVVRFADWYCARAAERVGADG